MSVRYPGGFINRSAPVIVGPVDGEGGSAPGVWTLEQASYYTKQGTWPQRIKDKPLYSWGTNNLGQLGDGTKTNRSSPVQVGSLTTWLNVACGMYHGLATKTDGTLWAWGKNNGGQLGQGNTTYRSSPVQVGALTTWNNIAGGRLFTAATKTDGTLWTWGLASYGELGLISTSQTSSPKQVGSLSTWLKIACGKYHAASIKTDGTLWSWGYNTYGQLGQNIAYTTNVSSPTQVGTDTNWSTVSCGPMQTYAIKTTGTLWAAGYNTFGSLGDNTIVNRSALVQIGALTTWLKICGGYSSFAIKTDGTLWSWGANSTGQLGQNDRVNRSSPVQIGSLTNWSGIPLLSWDGLFATKTDGTLWVSGDNTVGQLGLNDVVRRSSPVQVGSITTWSKVAQSYQFALATQAI